MAPRFTTIEACTWAKRVASSCASSSRSDRLISALQGAMPRETDFKQMLCADSNGFSLHAAVHCGAGERQEPKQLRVLANAAGQVVRKLKTPPD
jgi:Zn ribbon nucleic-acid-binding protein